MKQKFFTLTALLILLTAGYTVLNSQMRSGKKIINLRDPINSMGDDFAPTLTGDGNTLIFNSRLKDEKVHNLYESFLTSRGWSKPQYMQGLNSKENDETPFLTPDGKTIIFASDRKGSKRPSVTADGTVRITFDLYISHKIDGRWTKPVPVPGDVNTTRNERCPSLTPDRKFLYFSRWRYKNIRRSVIMVAELRDNRYVNVRPLPDTINTNQHNLALAPSTRGSGFYFSSRRPGGFGGWDLYYTKFEGGTFTKPINLGPEINSPDNELFLSEAGNEIFFCSDRVGGLGGYDIFSSGIPPFVRQKRRYISPSVSIPTREKTTVAERKDPAETKKARKQVSKTPVKKEYSTVEKPVEKIIERKTEKIISRKKETRPEGYSTDSPERYTPGYGRPESVEDSRTRIRFMVTSSESGNPLSVRFRVYLKNNDNPSSLPLRVIKRKSDPDGTFTVYPKEDATIVVIKLDERGFTMKRTSIQVEPNTAKEVNIEVTPASRKKLSLIFRPIYFSYKSSRIRFSYYPYLHKIINYMRDNPNEKLFIIGHSDLHKRERGNYMLSIRRARAIKDYFVRMGLSQKRLHLKGMGSKKPLTYKPGEIFNELNRRVEFQVINGEDE